MKILREDSTVEQHITHIDKVLSKIIRRSPMSMPSIGASFPEFQYVEKPDDKGITFRYLFGIDGVIFLAAMFVEDLAGKRIEVNVSIEDSSKLEVHKIDMRRNALAEGLNVPVKAGQRIYVSVSNPEARGIWTTILWTPKTAKAQIVHTLIEDIDKAEAEFMGEISDA